VVRLSSIFLVLALQSCGAGQTATLPSCAASGRGDSLQFPLRRAGACLVDARGAPVWLHGEAAWSLLVRLTDDEVDRYLADRRARGVNALLVNLLEHKFADHPPANRAGDLPFRAPGAFTAPGEPYFAHVDRVLARAARAGMVVLSLPRTSVTRAATRAGTPTSAAPVPPRCAPTASSSAPGFSPRRT